MGEKSVRIAAEGQRIRRRDILSQTDRTADQSALVAEEGAVLESLEANLRASPQGSPFGRN